MMSTPWITHRIQHPAASDIIVRDAGLPIPVAVAEIFEPYAIAFHGAASDHRRQASIVDTLLNLLLRQHLYRFIIPVGRVYRLPETQTDWIDVRRKLAASVAAIRIVSVVRSTDLVVSSSWDDEYVAVTTPYSNAVLHKIVSIFGEEVASSGTAETRVEVLRQIAVEVEARFGCRFLLPRRCNSNSTVVYRILDPQCEQARHFLSRSFADWPAAVAEQLDDTLLMLDTTTRAFCKAQDIQTTDALLQTSTEDLVRDLLGWRHQQDMKEWKTSTAKIYVNRWKRMAVKHQRNIDGGTDLDLFTHQRQPKVEVNLSSILLDPTVKVFLSAEGITRSSDLFRGSAEEIGRAFIDWRRQQHLAEITVSDAKQYVYAWRRCVIDHVPEESSANANASFISSRADSRLSSNATGNFVRAPSQGRPLVSCNGTARAARPAVAIRRDDAARMVRPTGMVLNMQGGETSVWDERNTGKIDPRLQASRERIIATGQFAASRSSLTTAVPPASNTLNSATRERYFVEGDQEWMPASDQFASRSPPPYALNSDTHDRFSLEADPEWVVAPGQFVGPPRNPRPPAACALDAETHHRSIVQAGRERVVATGQLVAPPTNLRRPAPCALDWESHERSFVEANLLDRERVVAPSQFVAPPRNSLPPTRYHFDSETHHRSFIEAEYERVVVTGQFVAPPRKPMRPAPYALQSETHESSPVHADQKRMVTSGQLVAQPRKSIFPSQYALDLETQEKSFVEADRERVVVTGQFAAPPRNPMRPAPYALQSETHESSPVHADQERVVASDQIVAQARKPMPPAPYALELEGRERPLVQAYRERVVAASTRNLMRPASVSLTHDRSLVEADWERIVAAGPFAASTNKLTTAVPVAPDSATQERSFVGADRELVVAIDQSAAATRIPTTEVPPALNNLDSVAQERYSASTSSTATECAASSESTPTASTYKATLVSTFNNGGTASLRSAEDNDMSASVSTLAVDPLAILGATALAFLSTQGIVTASGFSQQSTEGLSQALSYWRQQRGMKSLLAGSVERYVQMWKQSVRKEQAKAMPRKRPTHADNASCQDNDYSEVDIETSEDGLEQRENVLPRDGGNGQVEQPCASGQVAPSGHSPTSTLEPGLCFLSSFAQAFLTSQGLTTTRLFIDWSTKEMAGALAEYRRQKNLKEWTLNTAERQVSRWKREVQERQPSEEEVPVEVDPSFEVFSPTVRSFLAAQSIANPSDFFLRSTQQLSEALVEWRAERKMKELKLRTAEQYVQRWRRSVAGYQTLATVTGVAPPVSGVETSPDSNLHQGRSALSPLRESANSGRRLFFGGATHGPKVHRHISGPTDNDADGGCENADDNGEAWETSSSHRMAGRLHELEIDPALDILAVPAKTFLASRGITTAQSLHQSTNEALAHALVVYRRQQKLKEWTFSTAQRYIWNWKHLVKEQLPVDGGSAKTRPAGRPPLDCDWDAKRGVWVPRFHREAHSKVARRLAVELTRRSNVVDQSSFTSASHRKVTFQDDVCEERLEEDNAEEGYGGASAKLNDSKDPDERQVQRNSEKLGRNVTERTLLAPRTGTVTAATANKRQDTGRDDSNTVDTDLYTGTDQSRGNDSDANRLGTSGKRSRSERTPNAFERSPKRGWKVVASSLTSSPK